MISTKGRYALRVLADLAENSTGDFTPLHEIAERQEISEKYLEAILRLLVCGGLLAGRRGANGGYKLTRAPEEYSVGEILTLTEVSLAPVACLKDGAANCSRASECRTLPMWRRLDSLIHDFLFNLTLADLIRDQLLGQESLRENNDAP